MFVKLMLCTLLASEYAAGAGGAGASLVEAMGGRSGGNRVTLCAEAGAPASCAGALLRGRWVLARASCLQHWPLYKVLVLRDSDQLSCEDMKEYTGAEVTRRLVVRHTPPASPAADLALLALDRPFWHLDALSVNATPDQYQLQQYTPWMEEVFRKSPGEPRARSPEHSSWLLKTPLRMFLTTMVAPTAVCALLFVVALSYVGGGGSHLPYEALEEDSQPPDRAGDHPAGDSEECKDPTPTPDTDTWPILYNL